MRRLTFGSLLLAVSLPLAAQAPYLVKDINTTLSSGLNSSSPTEFTAFSNKIYFAAKTAEFGIELWSTDGTSAGTKLAADALAGAAGSTLQGWKVVNNVLL